MRQGLKGFESKKAVRDKKMAEREGFEPSIRFKGVYSLSRRAPSTDSAISPR